MTSRFCLRALLALTLVALSILSGCNGTENADAGATYASPVDDFPVPDSLKDPGNPNLLVVGIKYVALKASETSTIPAKSDIETMLAKASQLWAQCDIGFYLAKYENFLASTYGVNLNPASFAALRTTRAAFDDGMYGLIARVENFNDSSELGTSNAYSTMPGTEPEGIVVERVSQTSSMLLSHELGHLVGGLDHTTGTNLMNHFVSAANTTLTAAQCEAARNTIRNYHSRWLRS